MTTILIDFTTATTNTNGDFWRYPTPSYTWLPSNQYVAYVDGNLVGPNDGGNPLGQGIVYFGHSMNAYDRWYKGDSGLIIKYKSNEPATIATSGVYAKLPSAPTSRISVIIEFDWLEVKQFNFFPSVPWFRFLDLWRYRAALTAMATEKDVSTYEISDIDNMVASSCQVAYDDLENQPGLKEGIRLNAPKLFVRRPVTTTEANGAVVGFRFRPFRSYYYRPIFDNSGPPPFEPHPNSFAKDPFNLQMVMEASTNPADPQAKVGISLTQGSWDFEGELNQELNPTPLGSGRRAGSQIPGLAMQFRATKFTSDLSKIAYAGASLNLAPPTAALNWFTYPHPGPIGVRIKTMTIDYS
jgi:hypothetical protein